MGFELPNFPMVSSPHVPANTRHLSPYIGLAALRYKREESESTKVQKGAMIVGLLVGGGVFTIGGVWQIVGVCLGLAGVFVYYNRVITARQNASVILKLEQERIVHGLDQVLSSQATHILDPVCERWMMIEHILSGQAWLGEEQLVADVRRAVEGAVDALIVQTLAETESPEGNPRNVLEWAKELAHVLREISGNLNRIHQVLDSYERENGEPAGAPLAESDQDRIELYEWLEALS